MTSECGVGYSTLYGDDTSRLIEQRVGHVEATDPSVGNTSQALPATVDLTRYRSRGIAVPAVVGRDAYRVREVGRDKRGIQSNGEGFLSNPTFT